MRYFKRKVDKMKRKRRAVENFDGHKNNGWSPRKGKFHSAHMVNSLKAWLHNYFREEDNS